MSQVSPGDDGTRQRPGAPPRKGAAAKRPPAKAAPKGGSAAKGAPRAGQPGAPKPRPTTGGTGRPPTGGKGRPPTAGGAKGRAPRQNMKITAPPPRRFSPSTMAFVSIAVVVVIVLVFVVVKVTGGSGNSASQTQLIPNPAPAAASLVDSVTSVSQSVLNAVGTGTGVSAPQVLKNQPTLTAAGAKPELLFIGAEFCPFCAAERWAMVVALSHFGTWSGLDTTTSSLWDSDPGTATFSFRNAKLTSQYLNFVPVEHETNDSFGSGTRKLFQPLTTAQSNLWQKYATQFGEQTGYPFLDFGNKVFVLGPSYDPSVLQSLNQQEIAAKLTNPSDPVTQAIIGTSNYLTAAVCALTRNQPASVCSAAGTHKAAVAMKLS